MVESVVSIISASDKVVLTLNLLIPYSLGELFRAYRITSYNVCYTKLLRTPWSFAGEGKGTWGSQSDINNLNNEFNSVK